MAFVVLGMVVGDLGLVEILPVTIVVLDAPDALPLYKAFVADDSAIVCNIIEGLSDVLAHQVRDVGGVVGVVAVCVRRLTC